MHYPCHTEFDFQTMNTIALVKGLLSKKCKIAFNRRDWPKIANNLFYHVLATIILPETTYCE